MEWIAILKFVVPLVAKALTEQVKSRLNQTELEKALLTALQSADRVHETSSDPSKMLFRRCNDKQKRDFLEKALKHPGVLNELKKPLEEKGTPDIACLVKVFEQVEQDQKIELNQAILEPWLRTFSQTYFEQTSTYIAKFQAAHENYLKQVANWFDDVKFAGVAVEGQEVDKADKLVSIFVMPDVQEEAQKRDRFFGSSRFDEMFDDATGSFDSGNRQTALFYEQRARFDRPEHKFLEQLLQQNRSKVVILGAPGSGKTTLLRYFAVKLALGEATDLGLKDANWLPILIPIRDWALRPELGVLEFVRWYAEKRMTVKGVPTGFFEYWLDRGRALILLDGLDEVADEAKRYDMVQRIENFLGQYDQNRAIVSSRPAGYKRDFFRTEEFPHYELLAFDDAKVETFIQHWYDSRIKDPVEAERKKESLRKALNQHDRIKVLARNPLLLTIVALIHRYQARLPRERYKLYDIAVKTLIESWDSNKELTEKSVLKYLDLSDLRRLMEALAYWIHTQGKTGDTEGGTLIDKDELLEWLTKAIRKQKQLELYQAKEEAKQFLKFVRERTGLLNEQGQDCYAFVHKTFQEYLCAQDINYQADNEDEFEIVLDHVREHLHDPHWLEVLLLLIAQQKPKKAGRVIRAILEHGSQYEQWLHRDLLFAGNCLAECTGVPNDSDLVQLILQSLVNLKCGERVGTAIRLEISMVLMNFSATAFQTKVLALLDQNKDSISIDELLEYRIALGDEEAAISELMTMLESGDFLFHPADKLGEIGKFSKQYENIVQLLVHQLEKDRSDFCTALALEKLGYASDRLREALSENNEINIHAAKTESETIESCFSSVYKLPRQLDADFDAAIEEIISLSSYNVYGSGEEVVRVLKELDEFTEVIAQKLSAELLNRKDREKTGIIRVLYCIEHTPKELIIRETVALLQSRDGQARLFAINLLAKLGGFSSEIESSIISMLCDESAEMRLVAIWQLRKFDHNVQRFVQAILSNLSHKKSWIRVNAARTLGALGKIDRSIEPKLAQWIEQNQDSEYVEHGIDALWQIVKE